MWIWPDRSPSMDFASPLVRDTKLYRTLVIALALAEVLVEGGERVGIPGLMRPTGSRNVIDRMAQAIVHDRSRAREPAAEFRALPARRGRAAVRSVERNRRSAAHHHAALRQRRARPCRADRRSGRGDISVLGPHRIRRAGRRRPHHRRPRRNLARRLYGARRSATAPKSAAETDRLGWSFTIHRTDRPASELLLALHARIGAAAADSRASAARRRPQATGDGMIGGLPLGFAEPLVLIGLLTLPVLWWLLRLIPPRPRRIDFPPTRLLLEIAPKEETPARTPWWLTLMRLALAALVIIAAAGPLWHPPLAATQIARADRDPDRRRLGGGRDLGRARAHRRRHHRARRGRSPRRGAHSAVRGHARHFARAGGIGARAPASDEAEAAHDRPRRSAAGDRAFPRQPSMTSSWCGCRTAPISAAARNSSKAWRKPSAAARSRSSTGGIAGRARARRRRQCGRRLEREGVARVDRAPRKPARCARSISRACRSAKPPFAFKAGDRETEAQFDLPVEIRNDIARIEIAGERSAGAVQLLDKRWRRRTVGIVSGASADIGGAAVVVELLHRARAQPVRRRAARARRVAGGRGDAFPRSETADADPRRCRQCRRRRARSAGALGRGRRRAGAFCRPAARRVRRRSRAGETAARRPHPRRQPELGQAAAARRVFAREPVQRHAGAERRDRHPAGVWRSPTRR